MQNNFCAVKGRPAKDTECSSIICNADELTMGVCRTCLRGKALLNAVKPALEQTRLIPQPQPGEQSADETQLDEARLDGHKTDEAPAAPASPLTAWAKIQRATGCATYGQLAAITGYADSVLRLQIQRLQQGKLPRRDNGIVPAIMRAARLTLQDLIPGAPHIDFLPSPRPVRAPATSSPPTPSGSEPSAEPGGTSTEGEAASEGLGSQDAYAAAGAAIGLYLSAPFEQGMYAECPANGLTAPSGIPADFLPYTGQRPVLHGKPALHIKTCGDMELSVDAVALGGLEQAVHVRPFWSSKRKQIGLGPVDGTGPGVLKLQVTLSKRRRISASGFLNGFGIRPKPGTYPVSLDPSGLIVATITQQPSQGGEA